MTTLEGYNTTGYTGYTTGAAYTIPDPAAATFPNPNGGAENEAYGHGGTEGDGEGNEVSVCSTYCVVYLLKNRRWEVASEGWSQVSHSHATTAID